MLDRFTTGSKNEYLHRYEDVKDSFQQIINSCVVRSFHPIAAAKFFVEHLPKLVGLAALRTGMVPDSVHKRMPDFYRPEADKIAEMKERLMDDPEGKKLLELAEAKNIPIRIKDELLHGAGAYIRIESGAVSKDTPVITINSNANVVSQTVYLFHELRHNEQVTKLEAQNARSLFMPHMGANPAAGFVLGRVFEADAFVAMTMFAARQAEKGNSEYLDPVMNDRKGRFPGCPNYAMWKHTKENYPHNYSSSPERFAQGLFDTLMDKNMGVYDYKFTEEILPRVKPYSLAEMPEKSIRYYFRPDNTIDGINMAKIIKATEIGGKSYLEGRSFADISNAVTRGAHPVHIAFIATAEDMLAKKDAMSKKELHQSIRKMQETLVKAMSPSVQRWFARDSFRADIRDKASSFLSKVTTGVMNLFNAPAAQADTAPKHHMPADMEDRVREPAATIAKPSVAATPSAPLPQSPAPKFKIG